MKPYPLYTHPNITNFRQLINKNAEATPTNDAIRYLSGKEIISVTYAQFRSDIDALKSQGRNPLFDMMFAYAGRKPKPRSQVRHDPGGNSG